MARPLVTIYQELAQPDSTPETPDLNTIVIGPAYDILDYPDDATSILLTSAYGSLEALAGNGTYTGYTPPVAGVDAVTVLGGAYPSQSAGSVVDHASVGVVLKFPRVILGSTYLSGGVAPVLGSAVITDSTDQTLITITGADFVAAAIQPGDRIVLTSSQSAANQTVVRTIATVGEPDALGYATAPTKLRLTANLPAAGTSADTWTYDSNGECRIERTLETQKLVTNVNNFVVFPEPGTDKLVVRGAMTLPVLVRPVATLATPNPSSSTVTRTVSYSEIYLAYRALRQDLQAVNSFTTSSVTVLNGGPYLTGVGKIDARNPLAVGLQVALANAGAAPVYGFGVPTNDAAGHSVARDAVSSRRDLYAFVPLTTDLSILASYKVEVDQLSDPTFAETNGVPQKFRVVLGSLTLPVASTVYEGGITGVAQQPSGLSTGKYRTISIAASSTGTINVRQVLPGDLITLGNVPSDPQWQNRRGTHRVSHVNSSKDYPNASDPSALEIDPGTSRWNDASFGAATGDIEFRITAPDGTIKLQNLSERTVTATAGNVKWAMNAPTVIGGPYTVQYVNGASSLSVTLTGFAIVVNFVTATTTHAQVAAAAMANATIAALMTVTAAGTTSEVVIVSAAAAIGPVSGSATGNIVVNDVLFDRLEDTSAQFLTAGVKPGDTIELPLNPNDYSSSAFTGRTLTYKVAQVLSENRLLIANGVDDTADVGKELPHYFSRDRADTYIDNVLAGGALRYRVRRSLSKDDQVISMVSTAQSFRSKRVALMYPDAVTVSDLRDGSRPRAVASVRELAGDQPGYYIAAQVGGALAGLPPQHGLTNLGLAGISAVKHAQGYLSEAQMTRLSDGGVMVFMQRNPSDLPFCIHQLTTDVQAIETGELSVVKTVDYISRSMQETVEPFLGQYNVIPETLNEIFRAVSDMAETLKAQRVARIGPPLLSGTVTQIKVSDTAADRIQLYFRGTIPRPLNHVELHIVV